MNINLDKLNLSKADPGDMNKTLSHFVDFCIDANSISDRYALPTYLIKCKKVVFLGMGASGIAGEFLKDLMIDSPIFVECVHDYSLPRWVDKETLVVALSHSGNTEEILFAFVSAYTAGAKLLAITTGGKLESLCSKYRASIVKYNLNTEPKLAFPYLFIIAFNMMKKLGYVSQSRDDFDKAMNLLHSQTARINLSSHTAINPAKDLANKIFDKFVCCLSSGNLRASGIRLANTINENGKNLAFYNFLPEMNHNLIAGFQYPKSSLQKLAVTMIESKFSRLEIKKRQNISSKFLFDIRILCIRFGFPQAVDRFSEILLSVNFFEYLGMYLGFLNQVDPNSAIAVEKIKNELQNS